jgi:hypothetical protein
MNVKPLKRFHVLRRDNLPDAPLRDAGFDETAGVLHGKLAERVVEVALVAVTDDTPARFMGRTSDGSIVQLLTPTTRTAGALMEAAGVDRLSSYLDGLNDDMDALYGAQEL